MISGEIFGPVGNTRYSEYATDILRSGRHLLDIINSVLDLSRSEAGKLTLQEESVDLRYVLRDCARMLGDFCKTAGLELSSSEPPEPTFVAGEKAKLRQIFLNLLSNAIKFSKPGGKVYVRVIADGPDVAILEIEDHGIGMTEAEQERALQPFGQAKPATTRNYGGTGLGLPITKGLVEAHGGTLTINSRAGCGTIVRIVLPRERKRLEFTSF